MSHTQSGFLARLLSELRTIWKDGEATPAAKTAVSAKHSHKLTAAATRNLVRRARRSLRQAKATRHLGHASSLRHQAARDAAFATALSQISKAPYPVRQGTNFSHLGPNPADIPFPVLPPWFFDYPIPYGDDAGSDLTQRLDGPFSVANQWRYEQLRALAVRAAQDAQQYETQLLSVVQLAETKLASAEGLLGPVLTEAADKIQNSIGTVESLSTDGAINDALDQVAQTATRYLVLALLLEWLVTNDALDFWVGLFSAVLRDISNVDFDLTQAKAYIDASTPADLVNRVEGLADEIETRLGDLVEPLRDKIRSLIMTTTSALDDVFGSFDLPLTMTPGPHNAADIANLNPLADLEAQLTGAVDELEQALQAKIKALLTDPAGLKKMLREMIVDFIIDPVLAVVGVALILGGAGAALLAAVIMVGAEELVHLLASWLSGPLLDRVNKLKGEILATLDRISQRISSVLPTLTENDPTAILKIVGSELRELKDALPEAFLDDVAALLEAARDAVLEGALNLALAAERALGLENATAFDRVDLKGTTSLRGSPQLPGLNDPHMFGGALLLRDINLLESDRANMKDGREQELTHRVSLLDTLGQAQLTSLLQDGELLLPLSSDAMLAPHYRGLYRVLIKEIRPSIVIGAPTAAPVTFSVPMTLTHLGPSLARVKRSANPAAPPLELPAGLQPAQQPVFVAAVSTCARLAVIGALRRVLSRFHTWSELLAVLPPEGPDRNQDANTLLHLQEFAYTEGPFSLGQTAYISVQIPNDDLIPGFVALAELPLSQNASWPLAVRAIDYLRHVGRNDLADSLVGMTVTQEDMNVAFLDELDVVLPRVLASLAGGEISAAVVRDAIKTIDPFSAFTDARLRNASAADPAWTRVANASDEQYIQTCVQYLQGTAAELAYGILAALRRLQLATWHITEMDARLRGLWNAAVTSIERRIAKWGDSLLIADVDPAANALGFGLLQRNDQVETAVHLLTLVSGELAQATSPTTSSDGTPVGVATELRYRPFENRGFDGVLKLVLPAAVQRALAGQGSDARSLASIVSGNSATDTLSDISVVDVLLDVVVRGCWDGDLEAAVKAQPSLLPQISTSPSSVASDVKRILMSARARASDLNLSFDAPISGILPLNLGSNFAVGFGKATAAGLLGFTTDMLGFLPGSLPDPEDVEVLGVGICVIPMPGMTPPNIDVSGIPHLATTLGLTAGTGGSGLLMLPTKRGTTPLDRPFLSLQDAEGIVPISGGDNAVYDVLVSMTYRLKQLAPAVQLAGAPLLFAISPALAKVGTTITLKGNGFPTNSTNVEVRFGTVLLTATSDATGAVSVQVPDLGTSAPVPVGVSVIFSGLPRSNAVPFVVEPATVSAMHISSVTPSTWAAGTEAYVSGQGFLPPPAQTVKINGVAVPWQFDSTTAFHFLVPATVNTSLGPTLSVENTLGSATYTGATWGTPPPPPPSPSVTTNSYSVTQAVPTFEIDGSALDSVTTVQLLVSGAPLSAYSATFVANGATKLTVTVQPTAAWLPLSTLTAVVQLQGPFTPLNAGGLVINHA